MAHGGLVSTNYAIQQAINSVISTLNSASYLGVFTAPSSIGPGNVWADLTEATFTGYARIALAGLWGSSGAVTDGEYKSDVAAQTFTCTGGTQTIKGWFVIDATPHLWLAQLFPADINMASGVSFSVQLQLQQWALSIVTG